MTKLQKFYKGKKIFITGNTGFLGSWLSNMLIYCGADVYGYSLKPNSNPNMFNSTSLNKKNKTFFGDIRNAQNLKEEVKKFKPEIIFHLAAQPLIKIGYKLPKYTFETNVIGTANILDAIRSTKSVKAAVIVTTDKVYADKGPIKYNETDKLGGYDPYSASKAATEILVESYNRSFLNNCNIASARPGNCIAGGDWSPYRIVPDIVASIFNKKQLNIRNPNYIRPWQHAIEPMYGLMLLGYNLFNNNKYSGAWNFGPPDSSYVTVKKLITLMSNNLGPIKYHIQYEDMHETSVLKLDSSKAKLMLGWVPKFTIKKTIRLTTDWYTAFYKKQNMFKLTQSQIASYFNLP